MDASSLESAHRSASFQLLEIRVHHRAKLEARVCAYRSAGGNDTSPRAPLRVARERLPVTVEANV